MMAKLETFMAWVSKNLTLLIFVVMLWGLANSYFFGGIAFNIGICATASFLMIYPMFINLRIEDIVEIKNNKLPVALSVFINFILSPLFAYALGFLFLADEPFMRLGLMLISLIPTSGMTVTWTERSKGNIKTALSIVSFSLLIVIIGLPLVLPLVAGNALATGPWYIFQRILLVIIVPLTLGDITRRVIIAKKGMEFFKKKKPLFSGASSTGLLVVLFLIMSLDVNTMLLKDPLLTLKGLVPLSIYYVLMFGASTLLARGLAYPVRVALVFGTSVRYLALALGIAVPLLGSNSNGAMVAFIIALAFFVQVPFASFYAKWIMRQQLPT